MYEEIAQSMLALDRFMIPQHGIPEPKAENPMNLFKR